MVAKTSVPAAGQKVGQAPPERALPSPGRRFGAGSTAPSGRGLARRLLRRPSPPRAHWSAAGNLGEPGAGAPRQALGQRVEGEEARLGDLAVGRLFGDHPEIADDVDDDVVAARRPLVEEHAVQPRLADDVDPGLLAKLAPGGVERRLAGLDAAAREMPAMGIGVADEEDALAAVDHDGADAERQAAREAPIGVEQPPDPGDSHPLPSPQPPLHGAAPSAKLSPDEQPHEQATCLPSGMGARPAPEAGLYRLIRKALPC